MGGLRRALSTFGVTIPLHLRIENFGDLVDKITRGIRASTANGMGGLGARRATAVWTVVDEAATSTTLSSSEELSDSESLIAWVSAQWLIDASMVCTCLTSDGHLTLLVGFFVWSN
jgi:hypothetical protein